MDIFHLGLDVIEGFGYAQAGLVNRRAKHFDLVKRVILVADNDPDRGRNYLRCSVAYLLAAFEFKRATNIRPL